MVAIAMALLWAGYTGGLYGYILVKGYDVSFKELISPVNWYQGQWPPNLITDPTVILPLGGTSTAAPAKPGKGAIPKLPHAPGAGK